MLRPVCGFQFSSSRRFAIGVVLTATAIYLALLAFAETPRAHMNMMQFMAVLFFLIAMMWRGTDSGIEPLKWNSGDISFYGLSLAIFIGTCVWATMLPFYFVSEDFEHLATARLPVLPTLTQLLFRGQLGVRFLRPVGFATIFIDYHLWHEWPVGYHLTNLTIHLATIAGLYCFCICLGTGTEIAVCAALIYAVMPIHAEPIAWMGARFDLLCACLTVWAAAFYVKFRTGGSRAAHLASLACFFLAVLSKENGFVLPLLLIMAEWLLLPNRRLRAVLAMSASAVGLFVYRWLVLGGIGGYIDPGGRPITFDIGARTFEGLLVRAPAQMLLGYNWFQPPIGGIRIVAAATAAVFLVSALSSQLGRTQRKRILFSFAWILLAILPAHPLVLIDASLMNSRVLHLGSLGLAILVAQVLCGIPDRLVRWGATGLLAGLLALGSLHNLGAWRWTSELSRNFLLELQSLDPAPQERTRYVFHSLPKAVRGVYVLRAGLTDAIRFAYGRDDLTGERAEDSSPGVPNTSEDHVVHVVWRGESAPLLERISP